MDEVSISIQESQNNTKETLCRKGSVHQKCGKFFVAWYHDTRQYKIYRYNGNAIETIDVARQLLFEMRHDTDKGKFNIAKYVKGIPVQSDAKENDDRYKLEKIVQNGVKGKTAAARKLRFLYNSFECYFCSSKENIELHHVVPNQNDKHAQWNCNDKKVIDAIEKCVPLCRPCHKKLHNICRAGLMPHGTYFSYEIYKCRCKLCCNAAKQQKEYLEKLGLNGNAKAN